VNLGERGFYATPGVDYNRETGRGTPFLYYTNGAAVAEVLIDRFTGEFTTTRVDLLMDVSDNISPGLVWPPKQTTICPLGPSATAPIASVVRRFRADFDQYLPAAEAAVV